MSRETIPKHTDIQQNFRDADLSILAAKIGAKTNFMAVEHRLIEVLQIVSRDLHCCIQERAAGIKFCELDGGTSAFASIYREFRNTMSYYADRYVNFSPSHRFFNWVLSRISNYEEARLDSANTDEATSGEHAEILVITILQQMQTISDIAMSHDPKVDACWNIWIGGINGRIDKNQQK